MTWPALDPSAVPAPPRTDRFTLEPLRPEHAASDHVAWMSSIDHIRATPGFGDGAWGPDRWPYEMSLDDNRRDLEMHWDEFRRGVAYAYTVLDPSNGEVIGCVYVDPDDGPLPEGDVRGDVMVRSWMRASHAELDGELVEVVDRWLREWWPVERVRWPGRRAA